MTPISPSTGYPDPVARGISLAAALAAIAFALEANQKDGTGMTFLGCWNAGNFDVCRKVWPEAPADCYIAADPTLKPTSANT